MPNEQLTLDYVDGWNQGARQVHAQVLRDMLPLFRDLGEEWPEVKPALTGMWSLLYGMPLPAPRRFESETEDVEGLVLATMPMPDGHTERVWVWVWPPTEGR
jgi:hypothetical protein